MNLDRAFVIVLARILVVNVYKNRTKVVVAVLVEETLHCIQVVVMVVIVVVAVLVEETLHCIQVVVMVVVVGEQNITIYLSVCLAGSMSV